MTDNTNKMLRTIINGQSAIKSELIAKIDKLDKKLANRIDVLEKNMNDDFKEVNKRIDVIGLHLEKVDEDTPTIEEFDKLEKRVTKVEAKIASI